MSAHEKINYIEFPSKDFSETQLFFSEVFNWEFVIYGNDYMSFSNAGLSGGFYRSPLASSTENGAALVVFYSEDLEMTLEKIRANKGKIIKPTFTFPGGRRFHFSDPTGNEFAVWSDKVLI